MFIKVMSWNNMIIKLRDSQETIATLYIRKDFNFRASSIIQSVAKE